MIQIKKGVENSIIVTLTELTTLSSPNYLFVFHNNETGLSVKKIIPATADTSIYPNRYNRFILESSLFNGAQAGQWGYSIYEQESADNLDQSGLTLIESGLMRLSETVTEAGKIVFKPVTQVTKVFNGK